MDRYDIVIVGGGIVGSSVAYFLASSRQFDGSVLIVEKDPTFAESSTARAVGGIRQQFSVVENIRMSQFGASFIRSAPEALETDGERPVLRFQEKGYLFLASPQQLPVLEENSRIQIAAGVRLGKMNPDELEKRFPWIDASGVAGATLGLENEGWLDQVALHRALLKKSKGLGVRFVSDQLIGIDSSNGRIHGVTLDTVGKIRCDTVVNAAGIRAADVTEMAGAGRLPVEPRKRIVYAFEAPGLSSDCPLVIDTTGVWFRPRDSRTYICGVSPPKEQDQACSDLNATPALFLDPVMPALKARISLFRESKLLDSWAGHYSYNTFDQNAIVGPHPEIRNLILANGFSGHGFQQAPAVGRAISEIIAFGEYRSLDLTRFSYERIVRNQKVTESYIV